MFFYRHRPGIVIAIPSESLSASARNRYRLRPGIAIGIERNMQHHLKTGLTPLFQAEPIFFGREQEFARRTQDVLCITFRKHMSTLSDCPLAAVSKNGWRQSAKVH